MLKSPGQGHPAIEVPEVGFHVLVVLQSHWTLRAIFAALGAVLSLWIGSAAG